MTTDLYATVLFNDGEGIDPTDLTAISQRVMASMWDQLVGALIPREAFTLSLDTPFDPSATIIVSGSPAPVIPYALALTVSGARPAQGSANNKVAIKAGTLLQVVAAADGSSPGMIAFTFDGSTELTIANGNPSNPRVDIIQMALSYVDDTPIQRDFEDQVTRQKSSTTPLKRRRVQCALSIKQGTPAASPTYPLPDAGNVVIAGIVVGTSYAGAAPLAIVDTAGAAAVLHDQRMPLRVRPHGIHATNYQFPDGGGFVLNDKRLVAKVSGSNDLVIPCIAWPNAGRLIEAESLMYSGGVVTSTTYCRYIADTNTLVDMNFSGLGGSASLLVLARASGPLAFQAQHVPAAGPTVLAAANLMGPPLWTSGFRAPVPQPTDGSELVLRYINPTNGANFLLSTWYIAEGM